MIGRLLLTGFVVFFLSACSSEEVKDTPDSDEITVEQVTDALTEDGLHIEETSDVEEDNVFIQDLNGVTPELYELDGDLVSVYVFSSASDREEGMKQFEEMTANHDLVNYRAYSKQNVLVFYVTENEKAQNEVLDALDTLGQ
ncbi:hypothetical protein KH172YL63_32650 [Bacillus sp. KH172YL63]|nr:hypothetical protein KH172YL63_32650 [Bacillus sp. KH172YL63]